MKSYSDILEEAAEWRLRLEESDRPSEDNAQLQRWLAQDPAHHKAFQAVGDACAAVCRHELTPKMMELREEARQQIAASSVVVFRSRWMPFAGLAACFMVLVIGALWFLADPISSYATAPGERRVIVLDDGSRIFLDSQTEVSVRFDSNERQLVLKDGQARFEVAHDTSRPFSVTVGPTSVVATGTNFNVERFGTTVAVTLLEGGVVVNDAVSGKIAALRPDQRLTRYGRLTARIDKIDPQEATSWEQGRIVLMNATLATAVERINRYRSKPIVISSPELAQEEISGIFSIDDPSAFVEGVEQLLAAHAEALPDGSIRLTKSVTERGVEKNL